MVATPSTHAIPIRVLRGVAASLALVAGFATAGCNGSDAERNKATTRRFFIEVMNEGRFDLIDGMFAPGYTLQGQPLPNTKAWAEQFKSEEPNLEFKLDGLIAEGDQVAVWWILNLNDPDVEQQLYSGINLLTFTADGRIKSNWEGDLSASVIPGSQTRPVFSEAWASNNGLASADHSGEVFELVDDYPKSMPPVPDETWNRAASWPLTSDGVAAYMYALRDYAYDAMLPVDWRPERIRTGPDGRGGWYNAPWLSGIYTQSEGSDGLPTWCGRDFVRGLYFSTPLPTGTILDQTVAYKNYEVVFYNDVGAYHLGRVWNSDGTANFGNFQFPDGTVVVKLVFTSADDDPKSLKDAPRWTAYLPTEPECLKPEFGKVALLQMDILFKDTVNSPTGWVFTTYVYDVNHPDENAWRRMVPLGAMWGDDPGVYPGGELSETVINPDAPEWFSWNLGWGGRLSGPIDGAKGTGSCLSCHATSEFSLDRDAKLEANFLPPAGLSDEEKMKRWFRNIPGDEPWSGKTGGWMELDYSFVTLGGLAHFHSRAGTETAPSVFRDRDRF